MVVFLRVGGGGLYQGMPVGWWRYQVARANPGGDVAGGIFMYLFLFGDNNIKVLPVSVWGEGGGWINFPS